jgi:hypothetical protein
MGTGYGNGIPRGDSMEKVLLRPKRCLPLSSPDGMAKQLKIALWCKGAEDL